MSLDWTSIITKCFGALLVVLVGIAGFFKARADAKAEQKAKDVAAATVATVNSEVASHEAADQAEARRDPAAHSGTDIVSGTALPGWLKRQ